MAGIYITPDNVRERITHRVIEQVFDDDSDGNWAANLDAAVEDAESMIEQSIAKTYGQAGLTWLRAEGFDAPRAVKRLCLDVFEVRMGTRHPEYIAANWNQRRTWVREDLKELRLRDVQLDVVGDPEPAMNEGGVVQSGDPDDPDPKDKFFLDGMGIF